jgi:DNA-directed RNA polymerase subunit H (RpoH/RPB5)
MNSVEHLLEVKRSTIKIMKIRGYDITDEDLGFLETDYTDEYKQELIEYFIESSETNELREYLLEKNLTDLRSLMSNIYVRDKDRCLVFFTEHKGTKNFLTEDANFLRDILVFTGVELCMIISYNPNGCIKRLNEIELKTKEIIMYNEDKGKNIKLKRFIETPIHIQFFQDIDLLYDPLDHLYSPLSITKLSSAKIKKTGLILEELPHISENDPIIQRLGFFHGDIVLMEIPSLIRGSLLDSELVYKLVKKDKEKKKK